MKHWTWEKVRAEMDAAIAEGNVERFDLAGVPAALYLRSCPSRAEGALYSDGVYWSRPYRSRGVTVDPTKPDDIKAVRTSR